MLWCFLVVFLFSRQKHVVFSLDKENKRRHLEDKFIGGKLSRYLDYSPLLNVYFSVFHCLLYDKSYYTTLSPDKNISQADIRSYTYLFRFSKTFCRILRKKGVNITDNCLYVSSIDQSLDVEKALEKASAMHKLMESMAAKLVTTRSVLGVIDVRIQFQIIMISSSE